MVRRRRNPHGFGGSASRAKFARFGLLKAIGRLKLERILGQILIHLPVLVALDKDAASEGALREIAANLHDVRLPFRRDPDLPVELLLGELYLSGKKSPTWNFVAIAGTIGIFLTILLFLVPWKPETAQFTLTAITLPLILAILQFLVERALG